MRMKPPPQIELGAKAVGARIAACRRANRWTQLDLAKRTGIYPSTVGIIEVGLRLPTFRQAIVLAVVFRRSLKWLLFGAPRNMKLWRAVEQQS